MKDLLPNSFWPKGSTSHFVDYCAENDKVADLLLRVWQTQEYDLIQVIVDKFCSENKGEDLFNFARFSFCIDENIYKEIENILSIKLEKMMDLLKVSIQKKKPLPDTSLITLISKYWKLRNVDHALWTDLTMILDQREKYAGGIEVSHKNKAKEKVTNKLSNLIHWEGRLIECQRLMNEYGLSDKITKPFEQHFTTKLKDEALQKLADQLLKENKAPAQYNQRSQLFNYLFNHGYIKNDLAAETKTNYFARFEKAQINLPKLTLEWVKCKSLAEANKKKTQLHLWQCILPPNGLVNLIASFLEFQYQDPKWDDEQKLNSLNQAERQLPTLQQLLAIHIKYLKKTCAYQQGLQKKIAQAKFQAYMKDDRPSNAFEVYLEGIFNNWDWTKESFEAHAETFISELKKQKNQDLAFMATLRLHQHHKEQPLVAAFIKEQIEAYSKDYSNIKNDGDLEASVLGISKIYRAMALGNPFKTVSKTLEQYREKIEEQRRDSVQALSRDVGSLLGEAFSSHPLADSGGEGGDSNGKFEKLYEQFRDVMLQQDPFAKDTEDNLSDILKQAQKLIDEAKSIDAEKSITAFQNITSGQDEKGKKLIFEDVPSIADLIGELFLDQEPKREGKINPNRPLVPEQVLCQKYADLLVHLVSYQILKENNPLFKHIGDGFLKFIDFGHPDPTFWEEGEYRDLAAEKFGECQFETDLITTERYVICNVSEWLRFENQEALKVPFRKAMAIVCSNITNGIVLSRDRAEKLFQEFSQGILKRNNNPMIIEVLKQMRKASSQINAIDIMKKSGVNSVKFDRSIEPRVRGFLKQMTQTLQSFGADVMALHDKFAPDIYALDKAEFQLGTFLNDKETALKRYLHMNLDELTRNYLRASSKNSVHTKIQNNGIRVQQGINFKRSDQRNLRYQLVVADKSSFHTVKDIETYMYEFEENFPIVDRISGSRQNLDEESLIFVPEDHGLNPEGFFTYRDNVQHYQDNALKLARQLRILIMPGQGTGNYEANSHSLCIPLYTGKGRTIKMSLLSALADYLYHIKFLTDPSNLEETILEILNKKAKRPIKGGTHEVKLKITQLIYQEIAALSGVKNLPQNANNISDVLSKAILGSDMTMIYRELRDLSAPQKSARYKSLKSRYNIERKNMKMGDRIKEVAFLYYPTEEVNETLKKSEFTRVYHGLNDADRQLLKDEMYDLGVLLSHYDEHDEAYDFFETLTKLEPNFPEAYWGLATTCRHQVVTRVSPTERVSVSISSYKRFSSFPDCGPFWRKRADQLAKKILEMS